MNLLAELSQPWALSPGAVHLIEAGLAAKATGEPARSAPGFTVSADGVATVPIEGVLLRKASPMLQLFGFGSMQEIGDAVSEAASQSDVRRIVLNIDSPGGTVAGTLELAHQIDEARRRKPVTAFIGGQGTSAAYWLATCADKIIATPTAMTGSIGVIALHADRTAQYSQDGLKVEVFRSGELKAPGAYGMPLTDPQRQFMAAGIQEAFQLFRARVNARRPGVANLVFDGRAVMGSQAAQLGLVDSIVMGLSAVLTMPERALRPPQPSSPSARSRGHRFEGHTPRTLGIRLGISEAATRALLAKRALTPVRKCGPASWKFDSQAIDALKESL